MASVFLLTSLTYTHNHFHNLSSQLHRQGLVAGKSCSVAISRGYKIKDGERWSSGGCIWRSEWNKGSAQDVDGVYVYVCICVAGGWGWMSVL